MTSKVREKFYRLMWLLSEKRVPQAIGFVSQFILGRSLYTDHLAEYFASDQLPMRVHGNIMYLSPNDTGISRELFHFGTREREATAVIRQELARIKRLSDDPVVLDIGAHRGYYTFQAADLLAGFGTIYAVEPDPDNFDALRKGIDANGFTNVSAERCAIGDEETIGTLNIATKSNSHTLQSVSESRSGKYTGETVTTPVRRVDTYLAQKDVSPSEVSFVKIDVEGYEAAVFEGMDALLDADSELVICIELHPHRVESKKLHSIVSAIETAGFGLIHASSSTESDISNYVDIKRHLSTSSGRHTVDLIAKRQPSSNVSESAEDIGTQRSYSETP